MSGVEPCPRGAPAARAPSLFLPACLVALGAVSAALAFSFYFRGEDGDYNLYYIEQPAFGMNEYVPADASRSLAFPRLGAFACAWGAGVGLGWLAVARLVARRERLGLRAALARSAPAAWPLIALLGVPAVHFLGWPMTIGPVFLMILSMALCVAVAAWLACPSFEGRAARAVFSTWGALGLSLAYVAVFSVLSLRQYAALHLGFPDSGLFAEGLFHASRGEALRTNWEVSGLALHRHAFLILAPMSWLYRLWPAHEFLLVLQAAVLGSGGVAAYLLGRAVLGSRFAGWCLAVAYLAAPTTAFLNLPSTYGFSPMAFLPPLILWAAWLLERRRLPLYYLFLLLALLSKETAAPIVAMLGLFVALRHRWWRTAASTAALGLGYYALVTGAVVPYVFGRPYEFTGHLSDFGASGSEVVGTALGDPLRTLAYIFGVRAKMHFLLHLLVPVLLVPLLSPSAALVAAPSFVILTMSRYYGKWTLLIGAAAPVLPGLYLATVYGLKNLGERPTALLRRCLPRRLFGEGRRTVHAAALGVAAASALAGYLFFVRSQSWGMYSVPERAGLVADLRAATPRSASLCATCRLASHFTDQENLFVAPRELTRADYVVLDLTDAWDGLAALADYRSRLLRSPDYAAVYARDHFLVFRRGGPDPRLATACRLDAEPDPEYRAGVAIGGFATLIGHDARRVPDGVELTLYWRGERTTRADCAVRLVLATRDGGRTGWRYLPAGGLLPTWAWKPGEIIVDRVTVPDVDLLADGRTPLVDVAFEALPAPVARQGDDANERQR